MPRNENQGPHADHLALAAQVRDRAQELREQGEDLGDHQFVRGQAAGRLLPRLSVHEAVERIPAEASIRYETVEVGDLKPISEPRTQNTGVTKHELVGVEIGGQELRATSRFKSAFFSRFGQGESIFSLFTPEEVFSRIQATHPKANMRLAIEKGERDTFLLGVSSPDKAVVSPTELRAVMRHGSRPIHNASYTPGAGVVRTYHDVPNADWHALGEVFNAGFVVDTPIDGYGKPAIYLMMVRAICTNGAIALSTAFKTELALGNNDAVLEPLSRHLDSFNNEQGFDALTRRIEAAKNTSLSVAEYLALQDALAQAMTVKPHETLLGKPFINLVGDLSEIFHVPSAEFMPPKRRKILPMRATVAQAIDFATEALTYHTDLFQRPDRVNAWVGDMLASRDGGYDLEGVDVPQGILSKSQAFYLPPPERLAA